MRRLGHREIPIRCDVAIRICVHTTMHKTQTSVGMQKQLNAKKATFSLLFRAKMPLKSQFVRFISTFLSVIHGYPRVTVRASRSHIHLRWFWPFQSSFILSFRCDFIRFVVLHLQQIFKKKMKSCEKVPVGKAKSQRNVCSHLRLLIEAQCCTHVQSPVCQRT